ALQLVDGRSKGGHDVALIMAIDALVRRSTIGGGSDSGWELDGDSVLNRIIAAL
ncbi:hypothetical protein Tco_0296935, partial [Tanacetum coccineum]